MKKHTYRSVELQQVRLDEVLPKLKDGCIVALDVAKQKFVVALATLNGEVVKLLRFNHPTETRAFLELVRGVVAGLPPGQVKVALEPTGTYGDAIRHLLAESLQLPIYMVSPKRTHDSQALFDGVSSLHDPKSAALLAKLCSMNLGQLWTAPQKWRVQLRALVEQRQHEYRTQERCLGRLEGLLARHWPEFGQWLDPREQVSAMKLLIEFGSPAQVDASPEEARALLRQASRGRFSTELLEGVLSDAHSSLGLPMQPQEQSFVKSLAQQARDAGLRMDQMERQMHELAQDNKAFVALEKWMGTYTAAVVVSLCDPTQYTNARQLEKACGLNVREKSSGEHKGLLKITKRGPGLVRQVLYLFALRMLQQSPVARAWYERRQGHTEESKLRAAVALMRKLVKAMLHVARGEAFDAAKLFDVRRLKLQPAQSGQRKGRPAPRKESRPIARGQRRERVSATAAR